MGGQIQSEEERRRALGALVVLGCRVRGEKPGPALLRRLETAAHAHRAYPTLPVIMSGGRLWDGRSESEIMGRWWLENVGPDPRIILENVSQTTRQNAIEVARVCAELGYRHVVLVTCDFHCSRASRIFRRTGLRVTTVPAHKGRTFFERLRLRLREWGAEILGRFEGWVS